MTTLELHVARRSWAALGTTCTVLVTDRAALEPACTAVMAVLELADATYSRFRADSELSRLNEAGRPTVVSPLLAEALEAALRAARLTDGAVDPTVGRTMRALGYGADFAALAGRDVPLELHLEAVPGWQAIGYQGTARRVTPAARRGAGPGVGRQGPGGGSRRGGRPSGRRRGRPGEPGRRHRHRRRGTGAGLADPRRRRQRRPGRRPGRGRADHQRRDGHLQHHRAALDPGRHPAPPPRRPGHGQAGREPVAHGDRGRRLVRRCQHGRHGGHRQGRSGTRLAGRGGPADAPRGGRRAPAAPQPLADAAVVAA